MYWLLQTISVNAVYGVLAAAMRQCHLNNILARSANLPEGLYILPMFFLYFF